MEPTTFSALHAMEKLGYVVRRQVPGQPQEGLRPPDAEGPAAEGQAGAAGRGGERHRGRRSRGTQIATTRETLLAIIENLARDEAQAAGEQRRMPSTRAMSDRLKAGPQKRAPRAQPRSGLGLPRE